MEYWLAKYKLLTAHGTMKQQMDCRLHLLSLLPDSDVTTYMEIVRELIKVTCALWQLHFQWRIVVFRLDLRRLMRDEVTAWLSI